MEQSRCNADAKHIRHFLDICDGNWHSCIYVRCVSCKTPGYCNGPHFLYHPDENGSPCVLPMADARMLFSRIPEPTECLSAITLEQFQSLYASYVYGNKAKDGKLYVCSHFPQCNSYVGVHPGTTNAKGKLANKELRQKRIQAHRVFDQIWLNHIFTKSEAYRWIADKFCLTAKEAHIGEFSTYMCDQLILESMKILENNHIPLRAIG